MLGRPIITILALSFIAAPALAGEPAGDTLAWNLLDCVFVYGTTPVPAALLAPHVPTGFRPFFGTQPTAGHVAQLGFEVDVCAEGSGLDGQVAPMTYASTWTPVTAPPRYNVPGTSMFVNWDVIVPDEDRRALMQAHGTPAYDGEIAISSDLRAGVSLLPFTVDYDFGGTPFRFDIVPRGPAPLGGVGEFSQYTPGESGSLTFWRTEWAVSEGYAGVGTITLDPLSWQAQALGTTVLPAQFTYGTWDYTGGKIVLAD